MEDKEFRALVITEASGQATPNEEGWLRSSEVCERWRDTLRAIVTECNAERVQLDRWLEEVRQRTSAYGGSAEFTVAKQEHARRISRSVQVLRVVQARLDEANRTCRANSPPPLPPDPVVPEFVPEVVSGPPSAVVRLHEVKRELAAANGELTRLRQQLARCETQKAELAAARSELNELRMRVRPETNESRSAAVGRQKAMNLQIHMERQAYRDLYKAWRAIGETAATACRMALSLEEARGKRANLELVTLLRQAIQGADSGPGYPNIPSWRELLDQVDSSGTDIAEAPLEQAS